MRILFIGLVFACQIACGQSIQGQLANAKASVLMMGFEGAVPSYSLNGTTIKYAELLQKLSESRRKEVTSAPTIVLLVHEKTRISDIRDLAGLSVKAGYEVSTVFVFDKDRRAMQEVLFSDHKPFTKSPPPKK